MTKGTRVKLLAIRKYGDPILESETEHYKSLPHNGLELLTESMFHTALSCNGVGLAAPQIGLQKSLAVIDLSSGEDPAEKLILINPVIISHSGTQRIQEGCLSLPGFTAQVSRWKEVTVRAQDLNGDWFEKTASGYLAQALQHEIDHLHGVLYIDHITALKRDLIRRKIRKLQKAEKW